MIVDMRQAFERRKATEEKTKKTDDREGKEASEMAEKARTRCLFHTCFAWQEGCCTALNDTDFKGRSCPFFKDAEKAKKERQKAFEELLLGGRLDIINRYEEVYAELGIYCPKSEDGGIDPTAEDDREDVLADILSAREDLEAYEKQLDEEASGRDAEEKFWED